MLELQVIALLISAPGAALKCGMHPTHMPGYEWRQPVILVDGVIRPIPSHLGVDPDEVDEIRIACWDTGTDSFADNGIPIILIRTKTLVEATRRPLRQLIEAQRDFQAHHQRHATDLESLASFGLDGDVKLDFEAWESGWRASTPSGTIAYRCSAEAAPAGSVDTDDEPELQCGPVDTLALHSLRTRYDGGRSPVPPVPPPSWW